MDFSIPKKISKELDRFRAFLRAHLVPKLYSWYRKGTLPRSFFSLIGKEGWLGFEVEDSGLVKHSALKRALITEQIAMISPGVSIAILVQSDLGLLGLYLFGSEKIKEKYATSAVRGETLICIGNTESSSGSDVANISMRAKKVDGGWLLNGVKAYVTNGLISDLAVITAISDPKAPRNSRISMFLVDLTSEGINREMLNKHIWIPSDLTRIQFTNVFVPESHLLGEQGRGLQQVLTIFTNSRVPISGLTLGTAVGAFKMALEHARKRKIFGKRIVDFQTKAFEIADFYARIEAARLMLWKACWIMDKNGDSRLESSLAKYIAVRVARDVTTWAADLFGASSVIFEHPIHKFPMDAWVASLGEGTQDVQKLVIFREIMKRYEN